MRKAVWVVVVNNYQPDLCRLTLPSIERFAESIQAEFTVIGDRQWPNLPAPYEKLQAYQRGSDYDWNLVIDADMYIDSWMHDPTVIVPDDTVASWMCYDASQQFSNKHFTADWNVGISTSFLVVPKKCHDALMPFVEDEIKMVMPSMKRQFILDEYCVSRNVAQHKMKYCGILSNLRNPPFRHINVTSGHDSHV